MKPGSIVTFMKPQRLMPNSLDEESNEVHFSMRRIKAMIRRYINETLFAPAVGVGDTGTVLAEGMYDLKVLTTRGIGWVERDAVEEDL